MALMPLSRNSPTRRRTKSSSNDWSTLPSAAIRSGTSKRRWRGTRGLGKIEIQIVEFVAVLAADLDGIAKARCREQRRRRAFAFDQRIGHQRRAVNQRAPRTGS